MTGFEMPTVEPYRPPLCVCGHPAGDHRSGRTGALFARRYGICLVVDCGCRGFVEREWDPEPPEAA